MGLVFILGAVLLPKHQRRRKTLMVIKMMAKNDSAASGQIHSGIAVGCGGRGDALVSMVDADAVIVDVSVSASFGGGGGFS